MKVYDGSQTESPAQSTPERIKVGIAEYKVTTEPALLTTSGLGSCIGIGIYDTRDTVAGLVHVMLPSAADIDGGNSAKFADTGVEALIEAMEAAGASTNTMEAKIAGGSDMLDFSENGSSIGSRNAEKVRETLEAYGVPVVGEDLGGDHGRSVKLEAETGNLIVKSANTDSLTL
jgi:chemotaxis protein CheD